MITLLSWGHERQYGCCSRKFKRRCRFLHFPSLPSIPFPLSSIPYPYFSQFFTVSPLATPFKISPVLSATSTLFFPYSPKFLSNLPRVIFFPTFRPFRPLATPLNYVMLSPPVFFPFPKYSLEFLPVWKSPPPPQQQQQQRNWFKIVIATHNCCPSVNSELAVLLK